MSGLVARRDVIVMFGLLLAVSPQLATPLAAQQPAAADNAAQAAELAALREQTIYVPYSKLRGVFEKEGRGVFLPYDKFQELWKAAQQAQVQAPEPRPPVEALITEISSTARAQADVLLVDAVLRIEILKPGWHRIPLRLADAAIRAASLNDEPARLVRDEQGSYALLLEQPSGSATTSFELRLAYAKAIQKSPGKNSVSLQAPQAPVNRWEIHIPEQGVKVDIHPLIAATQPPAADDPETTNETVVLAFVGAADTITVDWNPKAEGASGLEALVSVEAEQEVMIEEGVVRTRTRLAYQISRAELNQVRMQVPNDFKVAAVFDPNVRQWEVTSEGDQQQILVHLFEPATSTQQVSVELERFVADESQTQITVPVVEALDVSRQQGFVVLRIAPTLRWSKTAGTGLVQLDASDLPATLAAQSWDAIFRYAALPVTLTLNVEKVEPRIRVEEYAHVYLEPELLTVDLLAMFNIERSGVFQFALEVPADYELRQVRGYEADGLVPAAVDTWHADPAHANRWLISLSSKAQGRVGLLVQLTRQLADPNLATPTGSAASLPLLLPRVDPEGIEQVSGRLVIFAPESLRVTPATQKGAQNISFREATAGAPALRRGDHFAAMAEVLALSYAREPVELTLAAQRRKPLVSARQLLVTTIESGVVRFQASFFYDIRYSPVKSLRIDLPSAVSTAVRNETPRLREQILAPAPEDVPEGYVAWQFSGETELMGEVALVLAWQQNLEPLGIGESIELSVPQLRPVGADRSWGQIVVTKSETIDIRPSGKTTGLRPIDPQHDLMPGAAVPTAARAFEFQQDWTLDLSATRYQLVDVKRTSIEMALLRMVVTRSAQIDVHALYRLRSARQRLAVKFPSRVDPQQSFDAQPLRVNGQPVTLELGDQQQYFIPLVGHASDEPILVELRYTVAGDTGVLDFPTFPEEPAVSQVWLSAYIPEERALLGTRGPWNLEHFNPWRISLSQAGRDASDTPADGHIYTRLVQGITVSGDPLGSFPVQGLRYLFTTLRPAAPPDGALRLRATDGRVLDALLFLLAAVIGFVFLFRPLGEKIAAFGLLLIAIVVTGVFWPTAALYLLDGRFVLAAAAVLLLWLTAELVRLLAGWRHYERRLTSSLSAWGWRRRLLAPAGATPAESPPPPPLSGASHMDKPEQGGPEHG